MIGLRQLWWMGSREPIQRIGTAGLLGAGLGQRHLPCHRPSPTISSSGYRGGVGSPPCTFDRSVDREPSAASPRGFAGPDGVRPWELLPCGWWGVARFIRSLGMASAPRRGVATDRYGRRDAGRCDTDHLSFDRSPDHHPDRRARAGGAGGRLVADRVHLVILLVTMAATGWHAWAGKGDARTGDDVRDGHDGAPRVDWSVCTVCWVDTRRARGHHPWRERPADQGAAAGSDGCLQARPGFRPPVRLDGAAPALGRSVRQTRGRSGGDNSLPCAFRLTRQPLLVLQRPTVVWL